MAPLLTTREAADQLGVSLSTLYRLVKVGAIPLVRVSARRRGIRPASLDAYVARNEHFAGERRRVMRKP